MMKFRWLFIVVLFLTSCADKINDEMNLVISSANGDLVKVKEYVAKLGSVNFVSLKGETPLGAAVYNGNLEVAKFLVESGANISYKDFEGRSSLDIARQRGHDNIYQYLSAYLP